MKRPLSLLFGLAALVAAAPAPADAFCGFYVAKADTKLFNKASQGRASSATATAP